MNVYYAAVQGQADKSLETHTTITIPNAIKQYGNNIKPYIYNPQTADTEISFMEIAHRIQTSDVFIGEMSSPSQTLGFQLAYALSIGKPVLYLYNSRRNGKPDTSIAEHPSRLLRVSTYNDDVDVIDVLSSFFEYSKKQMNSTRTSFMSTHRIDDYITKAAKKLGTSKAEVIRQLLDESIGLNTLLVPND